jgi:hypothetical protein
MKSVVVPKLLHWPKQKKTLATHLCSLGWLIALALIIITGAHEAYSDSRKIGDRDRKFFHLAQAKVVNDSVQLSFSSKDTARRLNTSLATSEIFGDNEDSPGGTVLEGYMKLRAGQPEFLQVLVRSARYVEDLGGSFPVYTVATHFFKSQKTVLEVLTNEQLLALSRAFSERDAAKAANQAVARYVYFEPGRSAAKQVHSKTAAATRFGFLGRGRQGRGGRGNCGCQAPVPQNPCSRGSSCQPTTPPTTGGSLCSGGATPERCGTFNGPWGPGAQYCCSPLACLNATQALCGIPTATPTPTATATATETPIPEEDEEEEEVIEPPVVEPPTQQPPTQQPPTQQPPTQQPPTQQPPTQQPPTQQ